MPATATVFSILIMIAFGLAVLALLPRVPCHPLLEIAVLLVCIALFVTTR